MIADFYHSCHYCLNPFSYNENIWPRYTPVHACQVSNTIFKPRLEVIDLMRVNNEEKTQKSPFFYEKGHFYQIFAQMTPHREVFAT